MDSYITADPERKYEDIIVTCLYFAIGVGICIHHFKKTKYTVRYTAGLLIAGLLIGYVDSQTKFFKVSNLETLLHDNLLFYYISYPLSLFWMCMGINRPIFVKSLPQILLIGIFGLVLTGLFASLLVHLAQDSGYPFLADSLIVLCNVITFPVIPLTLFQQIGPSVTPLANILAGECIFGNILFRTVIRFVVQHSRPEANWIDLLIFLAIYIFGAIGFSLIMTFPVKAIVQFFSKDVKTVLIITLTLPLLLVSISSTLSINSTLVILVLGITLNQKRERIVPETNAMITMFYDLLLFLINCVIHFYSGLVFGAFCFCELELFDITIMAIGYIAVMLGRFLMLYAASFIIRRWEFGLSMQHLIILGWSAFPGAPNLYLLLDLFFGIDFKLNAKTFRRYKHAIGTFVLLIVINRIVFTYFCKIMEISKLSLAKEQNMNNCMLYIIKKRSTLIEVIKMDRFLADANWPLVRHATKFWHPYNRSFNPTQESNMFSMGIRPSTCPDCQVEFLTAPNAREFMEMQKESEFKVYKAIQISYAKQCEAGVLNKTSLNVLININDLVAEKSFKSGAHEISKLFKGQGLIVRKLKNFLIDSMYSSQIKSLQLRTPRKYFRKLCYKIITNGFYEFFVTVLIICYLVCILFNKRIANSVNAIEEMTFFEINLVFSILFLLDFYLKILAHSFIYIKDGIIAYFKPKWNCYEFAVLIVGIILTLASATLLIIEVNYEDKTLELMRLSALILCSIRLIGLLKLFALAKKSFPFIVKCINNNIDNRMIFAYDIGRGHAKACESVIEELDTLVENQQIQQTIRDRLTKEWEIMFKELSTIQKDKPWIAITVKTKHAIKYVLKNMVAGIEDLKSSGWLDFEEYLQVMNSVNLCHAIYSKLGIISISEPDVILSEIVWMSKDPKIVSYILENSVLQIFEANSHLVMPGNRINGIYVAVSGLVSFKYSPDELVLENLKKLGILPIVDYLPLGKLESNIVDIILPGNCIGELAFLTGRSYDSLVSAHITSGIYYIPKVVLMEAMERDNDILNGLEARLWKTCALRIAIPVLLKSCSYKEHTEDKLRHLIEKAFVPKISNYSKFHNSCLIEDIILIDGSIYDANKKIICTAPSHVPRTLTVLHFEKEAQAQLLIIPNRDVEPLTVMVVEEEMSNKASLASDMTVKSFYSMNMTNKGNLFIKRQRRKMDTRKRNHHGTKPKERSILLESTKDDPKVFEKRAPN